VCPACGTNIFKILAWLDEDDNSIAGYMTRATCAECDTIVTIATPEDIIV
jgi:hypothetical protein